MLPAARYNDRPMIDPALLRERPDEIRARLQTRGDQFDAELDRVVQLDAERRAILPVLEAARHARKRIGEQIGAAKRAREPADHLVSEGQEQRALIEEQETRLKGVERALRAESLALPNLPHASVPQGVTEQENQEIRRQGEPTSFDFEPQPHWDLGPALGILDFERATRIAGARFAVLSGAGARLTRALINFMLDLHTGEHGYTEIEPPFLASADALTGTGNLPKFEADLFRVAGDWDLYLIPTAEVPLCNLHRGEILDGRDLPIRYVAYTPCFRSEAGAYGKDVRGLIRQHQFDKVELVAYAAPDQSWDVHEELTRHAEEVLKRLGLPYRTVLLCTGDMGFAASKTYDLEVWLPSQRTYREISSCSNTEAFQARRVGIRFRRDGKGKPEHVHTLNGSGVAVGRALVAILENFQQRDGSVAVPDVLRPYMGGTTVIKAG